MLLSAVAVTACNTEDNSSDEKGRLVAFEVINREERREENTRTKGVMAVDDVPSVALTDLAFAVANILPAEQHRQ